MRRRSRSARRLSIPVDPQTVSRRNFLATSAGSALAVPLAVHTVGLAADSAEQLPVHQATGVKVGEVTDTTALVWTRLTVHTRRNQDGVLLGGRGGKADRAPDDLPVEKIEGACPGMAGQIRLRYGTQADLSGAQETAWAAVDDKTDSIHHFALTGLLPDTRYHYAVETSGPGGAPRHGALRGQFQTAPQPDAPSDFRCCVMTCQGYHDRGHPDGHPIYPAMLALGPRFVSMTGDVVYYDSDAPPATSVPLARLHWERMFSLPRQVELLRNAASYWLKDDHDTLTNDSWPGRTAGSLTFAQGQELFQQQTPRSELGYRTFRWGRDLQIWLSDGRDHRTPNNRPDGPEKTIWGAEQWAWFQQTVSASTATWKLLISPTPLVGPDRTSKNDNHSNAGFTHEGQLIRGWLQRQVPDNFFVICGDRHWQYHSVHPETGLHEFSVGAASNEHAGGSPGENPRYHRFHRVKGGFLSITLRPEGGQSTILFEHRDVDGQVVYHWSKQRPIAS